MPKKKNVSSSALVWKDPPTPARTRLVFPESALRAKKGKWAVLKTCSTKQSASSAAGYLKKRLKADGINGFEARASGVEVYARFVG